MLALFVALIVPTTHLFFTNSILVLYCLHNHFFSPLMELQRSKWKIGPKIDDFVLTILYFWPSFCPNLGHFYSFHSSYDLHMPCKVHFWYCFICTTTFSVHLWIYSVPNGKLASKLSISVFWPSFCPNLGPFCSFQGYYDIFMQFSQKIGLWHFWFLWSPNFMQNNKK